ncbi:hypothetical protein MMC25_000189 [Agyrium rufum]|nr:hypothetical protein [Agyrium rufum]
MQFSIKSAATAALLATSVSALPVKRRSSITDVDILHHIQLEHLESVFYKEALAKMGEEDFLAAGYGAQHYNDILYIVYDEESHVELLTSAITAAGATPVTACNYSFPYTDVKSFLTLAGILKGVGSAAYLGTAPSISSKVYLSTAGPILMTEALHDATHRFNQGEVPIANPYGSALGLNEDTAVTTFSVGNEDIPKDFFATFVNGHLTSSVVTTVNGTTISAVLPVDLVGGQTYAFLTNANTTVVMDSQVLFEPAILEVTPGVPTFNSSLL